MLWFFKIDLFLYFSPYRAKNKENLYYKWYHVILSISLPIADHVSDTYFFFSNHDNDIINLTIYLIFYWILLLNTFTLKNPFQYFKLILNLQNSLAAIYVHVRLFSFLFKIISLEKARNWFERKIAVKAKSKFSQPVS